MNEQRILKQSILHVLEEQSHSMTLPFHLMLAFVSLQLRYTAIAYSKGFFQSSYLIFSFHIAAKCHLVTR